MKKEEVIDWLTIMKANLNSFPPEVSGVRKIEALAEAIRLIKNEQSIDKIDCDNADCNNCVNHKYCDYESNKSEIPTGSATKNDLGVELIDRAELLKAMDTWDKFGYTARYGLERLDKDDKDFVPYVKYDDMVNCVKNMPPATPIRPKGHWIDHSDEGYVECPKCGSATNCDDNITDLHFCFSCGAEMEGSEEV